MKKLLTIFIATLCALGMAACSPAAQQASGGDKPVIYASFFPIQSLVQEIVGDEFDVRSFIPPGQDPHLWEPTPRDIAELAEANTLVVNGANMEPWFDQVKDNLPDLDVLQLSDYVELLTYRGASAIGEFGYLAKAPLKKGETYTLDFGHTHEKEMRAAFFTSPETNQKKLVEQGKETMNAEGEPMRQHEHKEIVDGQVEKIAMGHEHGDVSFTPTSDETWYFVADRESEDILNYRLLDKDQNEVPMDPVIDGPSTQTDKVTYDPHSWMSVINGKKYANAIHDFFIERYPDRESEIHNNKREVVNRMTQMQYEYQEKFKEVSRHDFIVNHNAFGYLARDFGLQQRALQGLTTNESPSLSSLTEAIRYVKDNNIQVVFNELGQADPGSRTIVDEVGGKVLPLASMEYVKGDEHPQRDYVDYLQFNMNNLHEGLK
ncbi:hypothetical protein CATYP_07220 [Corynebacterium atypicum]|uniref:Zinc ABC transporter substrate-binding protein n=1 Tax=Corynebacterium atypicum TaxID=191610 RepID=A0ABN4DDV1_9CORY|nr:zinc ABC transporter substrate-binding protein [Corynebacterium atypicum]AIG64412.1 hypothetical protein CATYP_07220 [Corynebacterium atypicum]